MSNLLSRYAEALFWMARYVERAENLARILDVNETFSRDSRGNQNWDSVLQLYSDVERFSETHDEADAEAVLDFYILDQSNPASILSTLGMARENARTLRPLISTEMWTQINVFHNRLRKLTPDDIAEPRLARLCSVIKESCQTHTGITEGTFYRDEGWYFYQLGRQLERADQTTRLLDVKYHLLLPERHSVGSPIDVSHWNALLRSASAYHAFRRVHPRGMGPARVAGFLLFHKSFPRSVLGCIAASDAILQELRTNYELSSGAKASETLSRLRAGLEGLDIDEVLRGGLHEFVDRFQFDLNAVTGALGRAFFSRKDAGTAGPENAQS
ncbi:MAG: alpha-E domain-containing protein [Kiloniellales bacterium]